jgi:DNA-directed RNA polymerase subunit RPC12/RpoP
MTDKDKSRASHLKRLYGITIQQYDEMLTNQDQRCAICTRHAEEFKTRLAVDHNHITGEIRGLLCSYCNHRVIGRHRDADLLRKMADYVDQGTGLFVPEQRPKKRRRKKK